MTTSQPHADKDSTAQADAVAALLSEFTTRLQQGERLATDEFAAQHPECADELLRLLPTVHALAGLVEEAAPHPSFAGPASAVLGDFGLLREIGRGGMGVVYEAEQFSLGRRVALKILPFAGVLDERQLQRFKNEARAAATLDHPHIVHVHAVGHDRGVHYYAMQLIEGQTLAAYLQEAFPADRQIPETVTFGAELPMKAAQPTTVRQAHLSTSNSRTIRDYMRQVARWGIEAAEALDYAHQMGIVHRDVKPSNLLINREGKLWVADFGLAMTRNDTGVTMTGDMLGTLRYMSPEQILGRRNIIDQRTDVYSLGVTLYELLAREPAFPETDRAELQRQVLEDDPSQITLQAASVPKELQVIVQKTMQKEPVARYATAQELADDLRRYLNEEPIRARPPSRRDRVVKWSRRHRVFVRSALMAGVASLVIAVVAALFVLDARQQSAEDRVARAAETARADAIRESLKQHEDIERIRIANVEIWHGDVAAARQHLESVNRRTQGSFAWRWLWRQAGGAVEEIGRHEGKVYGVRLSPDRKLLVSCGEDGTRVWDAATYQPIQHLRGHSGSVSGAAFSPDGRWLASTSDDGTSRIWDTQSWSEIATLQHTGPAGGGGFSPDGRLFSTGECVESIPFSDDIPKHWVQHWDRNVDPPIFKVGENLIRIWDTATWTEQAVLRGHSDRLQCGDGSDDGRLIASGDRAGVVKLWQMPERTLVRELPHYVVGEYAQTVKAIDFAHEHPWVATAGFTGVNIWNIQDGTLVSRVTTRCPHIRHCAFSPDDFYLVLSGEGHGSANGSISLWSLTTSDTYEEAGQLILPGGSIWCVSHLGAGEVGFTNDAGSIMRWRLPGTLGERRFPLDEADTICHAAVSPDGQWLARTGSNLSVTSLSDPDTCIVLDPEPCSDQPVVFSPDGQSLVSACGGVCSEWRTATWERMSTVQTKQSLIISLRWRDGGRRLHMRRVDGEDHFWHFPRTRHPTRLIPITLSELASDRKNTASPEETAVRHETTRMDWFFDDHHMTSDRSRRAVRHHDGTIDIRAVETGETVSRCIGRAGLVDGVEFSPDDQILASFNRSPPQITLWHVPTGRELLTLNSGLRLICSLEFTSDGDGIVVAGQNLNGYGEVKLLDGRVRDRPSRDLTLSGQ